MTIRKFFFRLVKFSEQEPVLIVNEGEACVGPCDQNMECLKEEILGTISLKGMAQFSAAVVPHIKHSFLQVLYFKLIERGLTVEQYFSGMTTYLKFHMGVWDKVREIVLQFLLYYNNTQENTATFEIVKAYNKIKKENEELLTYKEKVEKIHQLCQ